MPAGSSERVADLPGRTLLPLVNIKVQLHLLGDLARLDQRRQLTLLAPPHPTIHTLRKHRIPRVSPIPLISRRLRHLYNAIAYTALLNRRHHKTVLLGEAATRGEGEEGVVFLGRGHAELGDGDLGVVVGRDFHVSIITNSRRLIKHQYVLRYPILGYHSASSSTGAHHALMDLEATLHLEHFVVSWALRQIRQTRYRLNAIMRPCLQPGLPDIIHIFR